MKKSFLYHQKKIVYRFISDHPVCAICDTDEIPLNSANCFIPACSYPWETIVALFNSTLYAKVYKLKFNCVKILRTHLEALPLPLFTPEQHAQIKTLYDKIRTTIPNVSITTDIIVGFPGESEEDFRDSLDIVEKTGFHGRCYSGAS